MQIDIFMRDDEGYGVSIDPHDPSFAEMMSTAPQCRWRAGEWALPVTEPNTAFLASKVVARYNTQVKISDAARIYLTKSLLENKLTSVRARRRAEYTFKDGCPDIDDYTFGALSPYKHQIVGFDAVRNEPFFALFMDMGTGKTPTAAHAICYNAIRKIGGLAKAKSTLPPSGDATPEAKEERATKVYKVLVLAPKSVCSNWGKELKKHSTLPYAFGNLRGELHERIQVLTAVLASSPRLKVVAINYEAIEKMLPMLRACRFDEVIADESTRIKTMAAKRTKAAIELVMPNGEHQPRRRILSGQPITKNVLDLYAQCEFLRPGNNPLGYTEFAPFARRFTKQDPYSKRPQPVNVEELKAVVGQFSFVVKKHECLDLPPKQYVREDVEMTKEQAEFYEKIEEDILQQLESEVGKAFSISAGNTLTLLLRLAQITSGFVPEDIDPEDSKKYREIKEFKPNPKLERLVELVDELVDLNGPGQKVLIWACFKSDIRAIETALADIGIASVTFYGGTSDKERESSLRMFESNDNIRVFIGHPQSGGIGLTLTGSETCPTGTAIYFSRNFSLEQRSQSEDRAHRIGMFRPLTIIDLLCAFPDGWKRPGKKLHTIDQRILTRLVEKKDMAEGFTDARSIAMSMLGIGPEAPAAST